MLLIISNRSLANSTQYAFANPGEEYKISTQKYKKEV